MPLSDNRQYRYPTSKSGPDLAAHLAALAEDVDEDVEAMEVSVLGLGRDLRGVGADLEELEERVPSFAATPEHLAVVLDGARNETWLGARAADGGPTPWAMHHISRRLGVEPVETAEYLFAVKDASGLLTDIAVRASDGQFPDYVVDRLRSRLLLDGGGVPGPVPAASRLYADTIWDGAAEVWPVNADSTRAAGWGSSSMEGMDSRLSTLFSSHGAAYYAGGKGAEWCEHTAARMGARPALVTVSGGQIPTSGAVDITVSNMTLTPWIRPYTGTLAGVRGTFGYRDGASPSYAFTRSGTGAARAVAAGTPFIPDAVSYRDAVVLLWMGKNNLGTSGSADQKVLDVTAQCFDWLVPLAKRCLVLGHFVDTDVPADSLERRQIEATAAGYRTRYGRLFVDVSAYVTGEAVWKDTGITPTTADRTAQALGNKPPSLSADNGHLNAAGYEAVLRNLIAPRLTELGWY